MGVSLLHTGLDTAWDDLFALPLATLVDRVVAYVEEHRDELRLRWAVNAALRHKAVLPQGVPELTRAVHALLGEIRNSSTPVTGPTDLGALREEFEKSFADFQARWKGRPAESQPRLLRAATAAPITEETQLPDGVYPCVVDEVVVPHPWFARRVDGDLSSKCFAPRVPAEKCCKQSENGECIAVFHGYGKAMIAEWMKSCRSPTWKEPAIALQPGPAAFDVSSSNRCVVAGVSIPRPWYRTADTPPLVCLAPKSSTAREKCCDYSAREPTCVAQFQGYNAGDVRSWIDHCRRSHWVDL